MIQVHLPNFTRWPDLERLSVVQPATFLWHLSGLSSLRSLQLDVPPWQPNDLVKDFLLQCDRLEVLDMTGFDCIYPLDEGDLFSKLGKTLRLLRLHQHESYVSIFRRRILDDSRLALLAKQCPKLRSLGLDLECELKLAHVANNDWVIRSPNQSCSLTLIITYCF